MSSFTNPLDSIKIASPCSANWNDMIGNNRQRFCGQCKLNVYNLSGMTRTEAENLLSNSEGRLCARFFRRNDGTIITKDCPVGWAAAKKRISRIWSAVATVLITALSGIGFVSIARSVVETPYDMGGIEMTRPPVKTEPLMGAVEPEMGEPMMGDIAEPAPDTATMGKIRAEK